MPEAAAPGASAAPNYVLFPISLIEETIEILRANGATFALPRELAEGVRGPRSRLEYYREYAEWRDAAGGPVAFPVWLARRALRRRIPRLFDRTEEPRAEGSPQVFLQHDADRNPHCTLEVMAAERKRGVRSAAYFFRRRAARWNGDEEPYELDLERLKEFEAAGFEIGYHLNGPELADYDAALGRSIIAQDVAFFREHFCLSSFVPHGGRPGRDGMNNDHIAHDGPLLDLLWFYNGRGPVTDVTWSDGEVEAMSSRGLEDPRVVARRVRGRVRARFLFHPQYYGTSCRPDVEGVGVTHTAWWRELW